MSDDLSDLHPDTVNPSTLVDRLRGHYRLPIKDGLGPVKGGDEPDNPEEYVRTFAAPPIHRVAAAEIERLRAALDAAETDLAIARADLDNSGATSLEIAAERDAASRPARQSAADLAAEAPGDAVARRLACPNNRVDCGIGQLMTDPPLPQPLWVCDMPDCSLAIRARAGA